MKGTLPVRALLFWGLTIFNIQFSIVNSFAQAPNTWTQKANFPGAPRIGAVSFSIGTKAYVGTGQDSSSNLLADFWEYDPSTNQWTQLTDFAGTPRRGAVGFSLGSMGYIGTGADSTGMRKDFWQYDPSLDTWTQKTDLGGAVNANARKDAASFVIGNKGYVITGYNGTSTGSKECWQYDGDTTWVRKTDLGISPQLNNWRHWAVAFSIDTTGYIGCGFNYSQDWQKDFWRYNLNTNTWTQRADFGGSARSGAIAFSIGEKGFVGTGNNDSAFSDCWQYDPSSNAWIQVADYGGGNISSGIGFSLNGTGYAGLGADTLVYRNDFWAYTPDSTIGINEHAPQHYHSQVFPNPFSSSALFLMNAGSGFHPGEFTLELFDTNGKKAGEKLILKNNETIERRNLSSGIYYYAVIKNSNHSLVSSGKIVID